MKNIGLLIPCLWLAACGDSASNPEATANQTSVVTVPTAVQSSEPLELSDADKIRVCRAGTAARGGREVTGISAEIYDNSIVRLSYTRDDGRFFTYDCEVSGDTLRFRMLDEAGPGSGHGIWSGRGSHTTFKLQNGSVEITDDFFDGSPLIEHVSI